MNYHSIERVSDNIFYVNLTLFNQSLGTVSTSGIPVVINKIFNQPILSNPSDWTVSLIRMNLYGYNIPIIDLQKYLNPSSTTNTILEISFRVNNTVFTRPVIWVPVDASTGNDKYYYYTYNDFARIITNTFNTLTADVNTAFPGTINISPRLEYLPEQGKYTLCAESSVFASSIPTPNRVEIIFNKVLYDLLHALPIDSFENNSIVLYIERVLNPFGVDNINTIGGFQHYMMEQEYQSLGCLNSAKAIIVETDLPVVQTYEDNNLTNSLCATVKERIISKYNLDGDNGNNFKELVFVPSAEFEIDDLIGNQPLSRIQIKAFWVDVNNEKKYLYIGSRRQVSFKLMFRRKNK